MTHRDDVGMGFMDGGVQHEAGAIDRVSAFHNGSFVIDQNQVGHANLGEMYAHRVGPIEVRPFRIADSEMPCEAVVEAMHSEGTARGDEVPFAIVPLFCEASKFRDGRENHSRLLWLIYRNGAAQGIKHVAFLSRTGGRGNLSGNDQSPLSCVWL
jgi:hypothetical protein